jgi:Ribbon-helix-helix protein, copG family
MTKSKNYQAAADWAEHDMTLKPNSTTALRGEAAAEHGRAALERALGGRPSIDPSAKRGQHSRTRQVRLPNDIDTKLDEVAASQNRRPSEIMRAALAEYLKRAEAG